MGVKLNSRAFDHAKALIKDGQYELDDRDAWSEHQPSSQQENSYIEEHGFTDYARWYLGVDDEEEPESKGRYKFPYGDFEKVHRCGVFAAEITSRPAQVPRHRTGNCAPSRHAGRAHVIGAPPW